MLGQVLHLCDHGRGDSLGAVVYGQMQQDREPGAAFHERTDRRLSAGADDQVALLTVLLWVISELS